MAERIVDAVCGKFALDLPAGTARTGAERTAALDHKAGNDSVKAETVIKALLYELFKVFAGDRRAVRTQTELDLSAVFHCDQYHCNRSFLN